MDIDARNAALACMFGDAHSTSAPATWSVKLYDGDPLTTGVELDAVGGYAALAVANTTANWPAPSSGAIISAAFDFGTSSAAWSDTATHVVVADGVGATGIWYSRALAEPITVSAAGVVVPPIKVVVTLNQEDDAA